MVFQDSAGGTFVQDPFYPPTGPGFTPELQLKFANQTRELMKKFFFFIYTFHFHPSSLIFFKKKNNL